MSSNYSSLWWSDNPLTSYTDMYKNMSGKSMFIHSLISFDCFASFRKIKFITGRTSESHFRWFAGENDSDRNCSFKGKQRSIVEHELIDKTNKKNIDRWCVDCRLKTIEQRSKYKTKFESIDQKNKSNHCCISTQKLFEFISIGLERSFQWGKSSISISDQCF